MNLSFKKVNELWMGDKYKGRLIQEFYEWWYDGILPLSYRGGWATVEDGVEAIRKEMEW